MTKRDQVPMRKGNRTERVNRLVRALSVQSYSGATQMMSEWIMDEAMKIGATCTTDNGNVYVTKGQADLYPCFVAHTDTVHRIIPQFSVQKIGNALFGWDHDTHLMSGVGGDDKVGVFLALQMLAELDYGKAAFFRDEEIGCQGASRAQLGFFDDCAFILQGDRRGWKDVVVRASGDDLCSADFVLNISPIVKKYNRDLCYHGLMTDVQELTSMYVGVSAINVSCGYYRPHSHEEVVMIPDVIQTLNFFRTVTREMGNQQWKHELSRKRYGRSSYGYGWSDWGAGEYDDDGYDTEYYKRRADKLKNARWDQGLTAWVDRDTGEPIDLDETPVVTAEKKPANPRQPIEKQAVVSEGRWGLIEKKSESAHESRFKIVGALSKARENGKKCKYPGHAGSDRGEIDALIETVPCPECQEVALMVDRLNYDKSSGEMLKAFCWACGSTAWDVFDLCIIADGEATAKELAEEDKPENEGKWVNIHNGWQQYKRGDGRTRYRKPADAETEAYLNAPMMLPERLAEES